MEVWCILVCHLRLTIIHCCTAVWAQACGLDHKNKFRHFLASLIHSASAIVFPSVCWWGSVTILLLLVHVIRTFATVTTTVLGVLVNTLQYHDTVDFVQDSETEDPQFGSGAGAWIETMASQWDRVDDGPTPQFSVPTHEYTHRPWKCDLRMLTGGRYDHDDVMRALERLDRPEIRPGTSGHNGKITPTYFTGPEVNALPIVPGPESCTSPSIKRTTGTRLSMPCPRTPTFARMERR